MSDVPSGNAVEMLAAALRDEGRRPDIHRQIMARHRAEWPTLWRAIDAVLSASAAKEADDGPA